MSRSRPGYGALLHASARVRHLRIRIASALAGVLALAACAPKAGADADDYAVWSAAIRAFVPAGQGPISVAAHTTSFGELHGSLSDLSWWMDRDYNRRNRVRAAIDPVRLSIPGVRMLRDDSASVAARDQPGAPAAHEPWIYLTRPGYGLAHRSAEVTITSSCGGFCGGGETMLLVRGDDGRWRKQATLSTIVF